ncbi:MAG: hypothetical protein ACLU4N_08260 [Butyricimonas faecihominis]
METSKYASITFPHLQSRITMMHYGAYQGYIYMYDELNHRMIGICDEPQAYTGMVINI